MTTLRVIVDQMVAANPGGIGRYTHELTRGLIATTPAGCQVEGVVSATTPENITMIEDSLPGLAQLHKTSLARRELAAAWQLGLRSPALHGMIHAPSLLAPLRKNHRATGTQVAITVHNVFAWTDPSSLSPQSVVWQKAVIKRARRFADAIIVPSHAVAGELAEIENFGDRIRVIGGAPAESLQLPSDGDARARELDLPERFLLTMGGLETRKGIAELITALSLPEMPDLPLLIVGGPRLDDPALAQLVAEAGLAPDRVRALHRLDDADLAVVYDRAALFVYPSLASGFGLPVLEAFTFGTPVVHSDAPALVEVAGDAGLVVPRDEPIGYPRRLGEAIARVLGDSTLADKLSVSGQDRARAYSWIDSAHRVWQLHADL